MSEPRPKLKKLRAKVGRVLRFMNHYGLREFEFEDKKGGETLKLSRLETESSPPLLEGRSASVPGQLRAPAVGKLSWLAKQDQQVEEGEKIAEIEKGDEVIELNAPLPGRLVEPVEAVCVQYGEKIGRIEISRGEQKDE